MGIRSLGWEDSLEEEMATHSSILAWRIPWTESTAHRVAKSQTLLKQLSTCCLAILFYFIIFCPRGCGILVFQPGIETVPSALKEPS